MENTGFKFESRIFYFRGITNILYKSNSKVIFSQKYT